MTIAKRVAVGGMRIREGKLKCLKESCLRDILAITDPHMMCGLAWNAGWADDSVLNRRRDIPLIYATCFLKSLTSF
jgi:hypothetical protein